MNKHIYNVYGCLASEHYFKSMDNIRQFNYEAGDVNIWSLKASLLFCDPMVLKLRATIGEQQIFRLL